MSDETLDTGFSYEEAFSRNIGFVTDWEQQELRGKRVAIAGMGGVGGVHLTTLARLGIGAFNIADLDSFELANFNRQAGAKMSTIGDEKVAVLEQMALDINPELDIQCFERGVTVENVDQFLAGVDLYVDGLDFFAVDARRLVFRRCAELGIPAITAAPLGMTVAYLIFMPGKMTFEQYFGLEGHSRDHQLVNFLVGLTPRGFHRAHLVDPRRFDLAGRRGPSTPMACQMCSGVTGVEAVKVLLGRGPIRAAPAYNQFDAYGGRWVRGYLPGGYRNPLQALRRRIGYRMARSMPTALPPVSSCEPANEMEEILDRARWAPSGDNSQPWRFATNGTNHISVQIHDASDTDLYDIDGEPTLLSAGCLIENMSIAGSTQSRALSWTLDHTDAHNHRLEVALPKASGRSDDKLAPYIAMRATDRRAYRSTPLSEAAITALEACLDEGLEIRWFRTARERWAIARINAASTRLRLTIPETFKVHQRVVDFDNSYSPTGLSVHSLGLDSITKRIMGWGLRSYSRTKFLNTCLWGTALPRMQMDLMPGMRCGGHFLFAWKEMPSAHDRPLALIRAGRAIQRFWLTATRMGLSVQPSFAPIVFARLAERGTDFTTHKRAREWGNRIGQGLGHAWPERSPDQLVFMGRIGTPQSSVLSSRSVRSDLSQLLPDVPTMQAESASRVANSVPDVDSALVHAVAATESQATIHATPS